MYSERVKGKAFYQYSKAKAKHNQLVGTCVISVFADQSIYIYIEREREREREKKRERERERGMKYHWAE